MKTYWTQGEELEMSGWENLTAEQRRIALSLVRLRERKVRNEGDWFGLFLFVVGMIVGAGLPWSWHCW